MARLIYSGIMSLDGYVADQAGKFDWSMPDAEVHTAINDLTRSGGTFLLGRRMHEVLVAWATMAVADRETAVQDFAAIWRDDRKDERTSTKDAATACRPSERIPSTARRDICLRNSASVTQARYVPRPPSCSARW
jgi:hypothetical protein